MIAFFKKKFEMMPEEQKIREWAKHRNRRRKFHMIGHDRALALLGECMVVPEIPEWAFDHCVLEISRSVHFGDRDCHVKPQAKMPCPPLDLLS